MAVGTKAAEKKEEVVVGQSVPKYTELTLRTTKAIDAEIGVYPKQLSIPK